MPKTALDGPGLVSIGQLARETGVTSRTIRYYEELGILPEPRRSPGGTRKYPREYLGYIAAALALKDLGFRLEEIRPLARLAAGRPVSATQRDSAAGLVEHRIEELARQVTMLRRLHDSVRHPDAAAKVPAVLGAAYHDLPAATGAAAAPVTGALPRRAAGRSPDPDTAGDPPSAGGAPAPGTEASAQQAGAAAARVRPLAG